MREGFLVSVEGILGNGESMGREEYTYLDDETATHAMERAFAYSEQLLRDGKCTSVECNLKMTLREEDL